MFFAAVALKFAFPITVYMGADCINGDGSVGRSVTMQSISSSLKVSSGHGLDFNLGSFFGIKKFS